MAHVEVRWGELVAVVGDNGAAGVHRAGYNGIWELRHRGMSRSLFVPYFAGLNLEHIFDGHQNGDRTVLFEPRVCPMKLRKLGPRAVELHQPPTTTFHLESWTRFEFVEPWYIDMTFVCTPRQHVFKHGYIGLFWASYINAPEDRSFYFLGRYVGRPPSQWVQLCTQLHNDKSTVLHYDDRFELTFSPDYPNVLYRNYSLLRYDLPFFYGHFEDFVVIFMFDRTAGVRFTHSPTGGGYTPERKTSNPAWDFQLIIPRYDVNRRYGLRVRLAVRPKADRETILEEYHRWRDSLPSWKP